jgi:hypothetical protein
MRTITCIILYLSFGYATNAQNLVANSSFEEYAKCPSRWGQGNYDTAVNVAIGWYSFSTSPDYFNTCCPSDDYYTVPKNWGGYQFPATGNGYFGITTYCRSCPTDYREIFGCRLLSQLDPGKTYFVSFKVSAGAEIGLGTFFSNNLGIRFSTTSFDPFIHPIPINNIAHVKCDLILRDTTNWLTLQGSFVADSAYQYLAIGNFFDDEHTKAERHDPSNAAYYFIDDVIVSTNKDEAWSDTAFILAGYSEPWSIYPNPASSELTVSAALSTEKIEIYNALGQRLQSVNTSSLPQSTSYNIAVNNLPSGCYFISIRGGAYHRIKKFMVVH